MDRPGDRAQLRDNLRKVAAALAREPVRGELLLDGQEEVFARSEVERGDIEHRVETRLPGGASPR
jgi:hypothetical protein